MERFQETRKNKKSHNIAFKKNELLLKKDYSENSEMQTMNNEIESLKVRKIPNIIVARKQKNIIENIFSNREIINKLSGINEHLSNCYIYFRPKLNYKFNKELPEIHLEMTQNCRKCITKLKKIPKTDSINTYCNLESNVKAFSNQETNTVNSTYSKRLQVHELDMDDKFLNMDFFQKQKKNFNSKNNLKYKIENNRNTLKYLIGETFISDKNHMNSSFLKNLSNNKLSETTNIIGSRISVIRNNNIFFRNVSPSYKDSFNKSKKLPKLKDKEINLFQKLKFNDDSRNYSNTSKVLNNSYDNNIHRFIREKAIACENKEIRNEKNSIMTKILREKFQKQLLLLNMKLYKGNPTITRKLMNFYSSD